jgi:outer membrane protein TolC
LLNSRHSIKNQVMKKGKFLFVLVVFVMLYKSSWAQQSILPNISEAYIARLVARAEANYPQVKSNQNKIDIAQSNIGKNRISYLDALTFSYIYQPQNFAINTAGNANQSYFNGAQAGIFFNLGNFLEKSYAIKQSKLEFEEANNEQNQYFLTLTNEIKKRYYTYVSGIANLKLQTEAALNQQNILNDVKHKFEKGEETFTNYTIAQSAVTVTLQAKIAAETNLLIAKADIEELLGEKLENVQ